MEAAPKIIIIPRLKSVNLENLIFSYLPLLDSQLILRGLNKSGSINSVKLFYFYGRENLETIRYEIRDNS